MPFISAGDGDLKSAFITDAWLIDQFVGNRLWGWGRNSYGGLGDNTVVNKSSPVQPVSVGNNWSQVSVGGYHTAGIKTDGTLWLWGKNSYGTVGDNTAVRKSSPIQTISGGSNWQKVACGYNHTAAIKTDGTLWLWGRNNLGSNGALGDNTVTHKSSPVQTVSGGTNWKQISCGNNYTAAIKLDGTLWCWGNNGSGVLGDNTVTNRSSPVQTVTFTTDWQKLDCGAFHIAAIKTDGTLWLWGNNTQGQLGDNTTVRKSSPIQTISGGTNWKQVACGYFHTAAIKLDGTLWCWGYNLYGQVGDNTISYKSSPVQTVAGGNNWKQTDCGSYHSAAIKLDGTLWCWGYNPQGSLGDNTTADKSSPVQTIISGSSWKQVDCNAYTTAAVTYGD
jgi:alpha-tubulin suppressor-like RCC1 family protein